MRNEMKNEITGSREHSNPGLTAVILIISLVILAMAKWSLTRSKTSSAPVSTMSTTKLAKGGSSNGAAGGSGNTKM